MMKESESNPFSMSDRKHLEAAEGWLELGLPLEAQTELHKLAPGLDSRPEVLELRWHINASQKRWESCVEVATAITAALPERAIGWIHRSFALHELKRTQEALDQLLPAADRFPDVWTIPYNLACYCSVLHRFDEGRRWLKRALHLNRQEVQTAALDDPDLKPLLRRLEA